MEEVFFYKTGLLNSPLFLSAPAMIGIVMATEPIISTLFGYGSFDQQSVSTDIKSFIRFWVWSSSFFIMLKIYSSFYFARSDTQFPFYVSVL
jgi:putative peptidoglycan lipid II flippase